MAQSTTFVNPMSSYSPFFSSGFLAPHSSRPQLRMSMSDSESSSCPPSPSCTSSPMHEDSTMDFELAELLREVTAGSRRSVTPTPGSIDQSTPVPSPQTGRLSSSTGSQSSSSHPRLRKRRSSLTLGASPMVSIRSPARSAGNALHMQMQLPATRSRSGSVGMSIATEEKSLVGRMRSGSCSSVGPGVVVDAPQVAISSSSKYVRPRRLGRRVYTTPIPAPLAPAPTTPLPSPPSQPSGFPSAKVPRLRPANINLASANPVSAAMKSPAPTSARARGLSVSSSALDGAENRIDEDMKEN